MSGNLEEGSIVWYKVNTGLLTRKIYITHEGIFIPRWLLSDIHVPYTAITKCGYFWTRSYFRKYKKDTCFIRYMNENGKHKTLEVHSCFGDVLGALKTYYSILLVSRQQEHKIEQELDKILGKFMKLLRDMKVYFEFKEPTHIDLEMFTLDPLKAAYWKRELGTLRLSYSTIHSISVTESGYARVVEQTHDSGKYSRSEKYLLYSPEYHLNFIVKAKSIPRINSCGVPMETVDLRKISAGVGIILLSIFVLVLSFGLSSFKAVLWAYIYFVLSMIVGLAYIVNGMESERFVDYKWQGGEFARRLNRDIELIDMLRRARAHPIEIRGNHIYLENSKFPSEVLFQCIERIAKHIQEMPL